jgi:peptidoglycan/xylan/chitin deacetylase (PgdA/CDA1 family)
MKSLLAIEINPTSISKEAFPLNKVKILTGMVIISFIFLIYYPGLSSPSSTLFQDNLAMIDSTIDEISSIIRQNNVKRSIPVFMYHSISKTPKNDLCVSPKQFEKQLRTLIMGGFTPITASELASAYEKGTQLPSHPFIITFDDGYADNYTSAFPILKKYKAKATIFVITSTINQGSYLSWNQLKEMENSGFIDIQSHTVNHLNLSSLTAKQIKKELTKSREILERNLNKPIAAFCYPSGNYNKKTLTYMKEAGYTMAFTTKPGLANYTKQGPFELHRIRVFPNQSFASLLKKYK